MRIKILIICMLPFIAIGFAGTLVIRGLMAGWDAFGEVIGDQT